ncbi:type I secretion system permease/ATPase [Donghicola sp. XS_ASV15]|uniref:type I secretion system permease/ATPase n=1 Tax=Donghicola sp. XS_ASV15 TaxID=3241295 RepID=UPI00351984AB
MNIASLLKRYSSQYLTLWFVSSFVAILALSPFIYLLQVSSRVFVSYSWETLWFLTGLVVFILIVWGAIGYYRDNGLSAIGFKIDNDLRSLVFGAVHRSGQKDAFRSYSDIAIFRDGVTGNFTANLMDATLTPLFVGVLFILHPVFGWVSIVLIALITLFSFQARKIWKLARKEAKPLEDEAYAFGLSTAAKSDVIRAMGLMEGVRHRWGKLQADASDKLITGKMSARYVETYINVLNRGMMVLVIFVGAVLFLLDKVTAETGMAAFIVMMRGVSPAVAIAKNWSVVQETRDAMQRLNGVLEKNQEVKKAALPTMVGHLTCAHVGYRTKAGKSLLSGVHFSVPAGSVVAVIGPSGAGKSTLLRLLAGAEQASAGNVKIDGFPMAQWPEAQRGASIGYLPQTVDLLPGTVAQNVSRFDPNQTDNTKIFEALGRAGALEMVQGLERGLNFNLAPDGAPLSGGQKQRIGLARAYYNSPRILIMDEPDSALDSEGEKNLAYGILEMKRSGATTVFSTHKTNMLQISDYVLVIKDGYMHSFSSKDDMIGRLEQSGNRLLATNDDTDAPKGAQLHG